MINWGRITILEEALEEVCKKMGFVLNLAPGRQRWQLPPDTPVQWNNHESCYTRETTDAPTARKMRSIDQRLQITHDDAFRMARAYADRLESNTNARLDDIAETLDRLLEKLHMVPVKLDTPRRIELRSKTTDDKPAPGRSLPLENERIRGK
jgi:hypothetical protein